MSRVNLATHSAALASAYDAVVHGDPSTEWALFSYDKGTNDLKVAETGVGLEELSECFSDGKMQYAFLRVMDPNTNLPKLVLISWCGAGVPESKKGLFASHLAELSKFLKMDVEPSVIMKRLEESGGSKYGIHKEPPQKPQRPAPVGSVYQPIKVKEEFASLKSNPMAPSVPSRPSVDRTEFERRAQEESRRKEEENQRRREKEESEKEQRKDRERIARERQVAEAEAARRREEEEKATQTTAHEARRAFEERERAAEEARRKEQADERKRREAEGAAEARRMVAEREKVEQAERDARLSAASVPTEPTAPVEAPSPGATGITVVALYDYDAEEANEISLKTGDLIHNVDTADSDWWQGTNSIGQFGMFPATYVEIKRNDASPELITVVTSSIVEAAPKPPPQPPVAAVASKGARAVALYDYETTEADELPLTEGEILTEVIIESEDWWLGTNAAATYVEMQ